MGGAGVGGDVVYRAHRPARERIAARRSGR
jgi:hypothetical protein